MIPQAGSMGPSMVARWPHVAAGGFCRGSMQKPLGKRWFSVCASLLPGIPGPPWSEQDRAGHSTPKTVEIVGKSNNSTNRFRPVGEIIFFCTGMANPETQNPNKTKTNGIVRVSKYCKFIGKTSKINNNQTPSAANGKFPAVRRGRSPNPGIRLCTAGNTELVRSALPALTPRRLIWVNPPEAVRPPPLPLY